MVQHMGQHSLETLYRKAVDLLLHLTNKIRNRDDNNNINAFSQFGADEAEFQLITKFSPMTSLK